MEKFGEVITDPYREHDLDGSDRWLWLLATAGNIDSEFYAVLRYLRTVGTILRPHPKFKWKLVPVVGPNGWESYEQYQQEAVYLKPWQDELIEILRGMRA